MNFEIISIPPLLAVSLIGCLCLVCQWLAWRFKLPAIVLLSLAGLVLGPISGVLDPAREFGMNLRTIISMAVAIILFDGGLNLRFKELKDLKRAVLQMVLIGAPLGWVFAASACHYVAGLTWPVAIVFGGILVVTGPTVIMPLLRQAKLKSRTAAVLKWEGIVNDPLGALFAVVAFEYFISPELQTNPASGFTILILKILFIGLISFSIGRLLQYIFHRGLIPEFLKQPVVLMLVLLTYALANVLQDESGLVAVTVLGITLGNSNLANLEEMRRFKEYLSLLLISLVFILITATLRWADIGLLNWFSLAFIFVLLVIVRPLTVLLSTVHSGLTHKEQMFIGWIAPRGVVCAAVSGLFGPELVKHGFPDGAELVPLAFAIVFATVIGHGFTVAPWGKRLGLISANVEGLLIIGSNAFTVELGKKLQTLKIPVMIADNNWYYLRLAREAGLPNYYGEILSEDSEFRVELNQYSAVLAASNNPSYNALIGSRFSHEFSHEHIFRLAVEAQSNDASKVSSAAMHIDPILDGLIQDEAIDRVKSGWKIKDVLISEQYSYKTYLEQNPDSVPLASITPNKIIIHAGAYLEPKEGSYTLLVFAPAEKNTVIK